MENVYGKQFRGWRTGLGFGALIAASVDRMFMVNILDLAGGECLW